jgi:hypothetical protein
MGGQSQLEEGTTCSLNIERLTVAVSVASELRSHQTEERRWADDVPVLTSDFAPMFFDIRTVTVECAFGKQTTKAPLGLP